VSKLRIRQLESRLEQNELEMSRRSAITARLINSIYWNLSYLCLTSLSAISALLLVPTQPLLAMILGGIGIISGLMWLQSVFNLVLQSRLIN
jgi:hypothetical protein